MFLNEYAYLRDYDAKISYLANLSPEPWSFGNNKDHVILKNYLGYTFMKLYDEGKLLEQNSFSVLHTGLYTVYYEEIFAYFTKNKVPDRQAWFLDGFFTRYQLVNMGVNDFPRRANYFSDPAALVFDTNCEIIPQYSHIFDDPENFLRIPETVRDSAMRVILFDGAVKRAKCMIDANYKTAVPQYYKGKIQLLIPICLVSENVPDLALVVSQNNTKTQYIGHTCLSLDMAYNNARLIARPDSNWLHP